jgi:hypothetical protein
VTGIAVDAFGNAYVAGYTSDPTGTLVTTNGFQTTYGGGSSNGFVMKILPSGNGAGDLSYGTFLGGCGSDQALAIAVGKGVPGTVYVTGTTTSTNFPVNGTVAAFQSALRTVGNGNSNAFFSVIGQSTSGATALAYSTYLGGLESDAGLGIFFAAINQIYVTGSAKSWDFSWQYNFQPFGGDQDAFVMEMDPTSAGAASLLYATPLGGSAAAGVSATAQGHGIVADATGNFWVAGATTAGDFPLAGNTNNGLQTVCASCQQTPPLNDAFLVQGIVNSAGTAPSVTFNLAKVPFGAPPVGSTVSMGVAAINTGDAALTINGVAITGANAADFSLMGASVCMAGAIAPGEKCSFEVGFVPSVVGPEEAFLTFTDNGPAGSQSLPMVGAGAGPFGVVSPGAVNFGDQPVNTRSNTFQEVTLTNTGNQPLSFTQSLSGPNASQFPPATAADTCASAANSALAAGASCVVPFYFAPTTTGTLTAQVVFVDNSSGKPGTQQVATITGEGTGAAPILTIAPAALDFGAQPVGVTSATQNVTFTNSGSEALNISGFAITGNNSTSFGYAAKGASACMLPSATLAAGASCTLAVDFVPSAAGAASATLSITDNALGSPQSVGLSGTGGTSGITIAPASVSFAQGSVGAQSPPVAVTITNTGSSPISPLTIAVVGNDPNDFMDPNTCPPALGAGSSCIVTVIFDPTQAGSRAAAIQISDNAPGSPQTIPLTGSAVQATASIARASGTMTFGSQLAGTASSPAQNVTITNSANAPAVLTVTNAALNPPTDFTLANNCKSGLAASASCTIAVTFAPAAPVANAQCGLAAGTQSSVLSIFDNDPKSPQTVMLSGTAVDYCLVPPGAINATVTSGSAAEFQLDAQPEGFAGAIALTCTASVPLGACTVQPPSVTLAGSALAPFTVNVTTTAQPPSATDMLRGAAGGPGTRFGGGGAGAFVAAMLGVLLVGIFGVKRRAARATRCLEGCAVLVVLSLALVACFGGGQGSAVAAGTPSGTYALTITGTTTTGATRTIGLTLTVE